MTFDRLAEVLLDAQGSDGGIGWIAGATPEPEPTAILALALDDDRARRWLADHQSPDGAVVFETGEVRNTGAAALNALALPTEAARLTALDFAIAALGERVEGSSLPDEPAGWGWLPGTFGWVEPTSRVVLATRLLRPTDTATVDAGLAILRAREVAGGGWNYGNSDVLGTDLTPYAQTTAAACLALQGLDEPALRRGLDQLRGLARRERGGLSLAMAAVAFRLCLGEGSTAHHEVATALGQQYERTAFLGNLGSVAWAALALRPDPPPLAVPA